MTMRGSCIVLSSRHFGCSLVSLRAYFRCSYKTETGCPAKKTIDFNKSSDLERLVEFRDEHNHPGSEFQNPPKGTGQPKGGSEGPTFAGTTAPLTGSLSRQDSLRRGGGGKGGGSSRGVPATPANPVATFHGQAQGGNASGALSRLVHVAAQENTVHYSVVSPHGSSHGQRPQDGHDMFQAHQGHTHAPGHLDSNLGPSAEAPRSHGVLTLPREDQPWVPPPPPLLPAPMPHSAQHLQGPHGSAPMYSGEMAGHAHAGAGHAGNGGAASGAGAMYQRGGEQPGVPSPGMVEAMPVNGSARDPQNHYGAWICDRGAGDAFHAHNGAPQQHYGDGPHHPPHGHYGQQAAGHSSRLAQGMLSGKPGGTPGAADMGCTQASGKEWHAGGQLQVADGGWRTAALPQGAGRGAGPLFAPGVPEAVSPRTDPSSETESQQPLQGQAEGMPQVPHAPQAEGFAPFAAKPGVYRDAAPHKGALYQGKEEGHAQVNVMDRLWTGTPQPEGPGTKHSNGFVQDSAGHRREGFQAVKGHVKPFAEARSCGVEAGPLALAAGHGNGVPSANRNEAGMGGIGSITRGLPTSKEHGSGCGILCTCLALGLGSTQCKCE